MDTAPETSSEGRTMVPLRFVSEEIGADVNWVGDERSVYISMADDIQEKAEVTVSALRVRSGPGTNYSVIDRVYSQQSFTVLDSYTNSKESEYQDWIKIQPSETSSVGWISADFVRLYKPEDETNREETNIKDEEQDKDKNEQEKKEEANEAHNIVDRDNLSFFEEKLPDDYYGIMGELTINANSLNVRTGPGLEYDRVTQVDEGENYPILTKAAMMNHLTL